MVYVTADIHGEKQRFKDKQFGRLSRGDTLIILGDFGFVWNGTEQEKKLLNWVAKQRYTVCFIDGTHENFELLDAYEQVDYMGAKAQRLGKNLYRLARGEVYNIEGLSIFCFGGGEGEDKDVRIETGSWQAGENATQQQVDAAFANIESLGSVDYVLTHDAPAKVARLLTNFGKEATSHQQLLEKFAADLKYKHWFFGMYHKDKPISASMTAVFMALIPLK